MSLIVTVTPVELDKVDKIEKQREYARMCVHHGLLTEKFMSKNNSPFHGDLMYHQLFDVKNEQELFLFNQVKKSWMHDAKEAHVYINYGFTNDMIQQVQDLIDHNIQIKFEKLPGNDYGILEDLNKLKQNEIIEYMKSHIVLNPFAYELEYHKSPKIEKFSKQKLNQNIENHNDFERVILESPFAGDVSTNVTYAKALIHKLAHNGIAASASHLLYTQMLDDNKASERDLGIKKGLDYAHNKDSVIGIDRGISTGMKYGIERAINENRNYRFQTMSNREQDIEDVNSIRDLKDAEEYVEERKNKNRKNFEKTGYINNVELNINKKRKSKPMR